VIRDDDDKDERTDSPQASPKKERVIHARIPAALDDALKSFASSMRVPVSNLVRALLEDAVEVTQKASDKVVEAAESVADKAAARARVRTTSPATPVGADAAARDPLAGVYGYQPLTLAIETACARCGDALSVGANAYLGLRDGAGPRVFICPECLPKPKKEPT
jgi:hypothetical protein